jgi:hypothetical protein
MEPFQRAVAASASASEVKDFLESVTRTHRNTPIRMCLVFYDGDLRAYLATKAARSGDLRVANPEAGGFELQATYGREHVRTVRGLFNILPSTVDRLYRLVTVSRSQFWDIAVHRFVKNEYPRLTRVFFRQIELREAMERLEHELSPHYRLVVKQTSVVKGRRTGRRVPPAGAEYDMERQWSDEGITIRQAFDGAQEFDQLFTRVGFQIEPTRLMAPAMEGMASCQLYRAGQVHLTGLYAKLASGLLPVLERAVGQRLKLFERRGLIERDYEPAKPLEITFRRPLFAENETSQQFIESLMNYPRATKALLHSNPYVHASVADFDDGSSFEMWVLNPKRILLIPRSMASIAALGRLTEYVFSEFEEGDVSEYVSRR